MLGGFLAQIEMFLLRFRHFSHRMFFAGTDDD